MSHAASPSATFKNQMDLDIQQFVMMNSYGDEDGSMSSQTKRSSYN